jgi:hypothetical protein
VMTFSCSSERRLSAVISSRARRYFSSTSLMATSAAAHAASASWPLRLLLKISHRCAGPALSIRDPPVLDCCCPFYPSPPVPRLLSGRADPKTLHLSEERPPITEDIWGEICHYAYFACEYAHSTPPEAQRNIEQYRGVGKALLPEPHTPVLVRSGVGVERPAFHLVAHRATKQLVLVIRGSANALDWLANFRFRSETVYVPRVQVNRVNGEKVHGGLLCLGRVRGYTMASCSVLWR